MVCVGARHLYLLDFSPENLPDLKSTIERSYPDVKVRCDVESLLRQLIRSVQVTTIQADAADDTAVAAVCKQAIDEEGQLDVFFANVCPFPPETVPPLTLRIGWSSDERGTARHHSGAVHGDYANQHSFVSRACPLTTFHCCNRYSPCSCFLAVKHASQAMMCTNLSSGKTLSSGSVILTASGSPSPPFLKTSVFESVYQLLDCARAQERLIVSLSHLYYIHNVNKNPDSASKAA